MIIQVKESSQTGETRRKALEYAEDLEIGETRCGAVALAATEMATNLVKHAGHGNMLIQQVRENGNSGLRLLSVDKGPGIADMTYARCRMDIRLPDQWALDWALSDVSRMSLRFTPPTAQGRWYAPNFGKESPNTSRIAETSEIGAVSEPIHGEESCGDGWGIRHVARILCCYGGRWTRARSACR